MAIICGSMTSDCPDCGKELHYYIKGHIRTVDSSVAYCEACHEGDYPRELKILEGQVNIFHETPEGFERKSLTKT